MHLRLWVMSLPQSNFSALLFLRQTLFSLQQEPANERQRERCSRALSSQRFLAFSRPLFTLFLILPLLLPRQANAQAPQIASISPTTLSPGGQATIRGSGFGDSQSGGDVDLWNSNFAPVVSWSDSQIVVTVPAGTTPGKVWVKQNGAWSNGVAFAMVGPKLRGISPAKFSPGSRITLTGSGFGATQGIGYVDLWNSNYAPVISWSDTSIAVRVPAGVTSGKAWVSQNGTWSNGVSFSTVGIGGGLQAGPLSFGSVQVGSSKTQSGTLTNTSGSVVAIGSATMEGTGFALQGLTAPLSLRSGESVTFSVTFTPRTRGVATGDLVVASDASDASLPIPVSGVGETGGSLSLAPASANLGSVPVGSSKTMTATLSASGSSVVVSSANTSSSEFTVSGISLPLTLPAGSSQPVVVKFTPQSSGTAAAQISFASNAANSPSIESLTGTGTSPTAHQVDLSWGASSSTVSGYNVYRGGQSGGPYSKLNTTPDGSTVYDDSGVQAGTSYYYVVTAVNSSGVESARSNEVVAVIPNP